LTEPVVLETTFMPFWSKTHILPQFGLHRT
jgi:hypothetical protein